MTVHPGTLPRQSLSERRRFSSQGGMAGKAGAGVPFVEAPTGIDGLSRLLTQPPGGIAFRSASPKEGGG